MVTVDKFTLLPHPARDEPYFWLMESRNVKFGVDAQNRWCARINDRTVFSSKVEDCTVLLPLLEIGHDPIHNFLRHTGSMHIELRFVESAFPELLLLQHALQGSSYWAERAIDWIANQPLLVAQLREDLQTIINKKMYTQSLRHRTQKMLARGA